MAKGGAGTGGRAGNRGIVTSRSLHHFRSPADPSYDDDPFTGPGSFASRSAVFLGEANFGGDVLAMSSASLGPKPRVVLCGLKRSGKSSIFQVIFHKLSPHESLFLETTDKITKNVISHSPFCQFEIWDTPGDVRTDSALELSLDGIIATSTEVIYVIDVTSENVEAGILGLHRTLTRMFGAEHSRGRPRRQFAQILIHKADALTEEQKLACLQNFRDKIEDELRVNGLDEALGRITFHVTSIFDHSIHEIFSFVVQRSLAHEVGMLENLLDALVNTCGLEKVFLFDVVSKIYVASDSTPVVPEHLELCFDMIEAVVQVSCLYEDGAREQRPSERRGAEKLPPGTSFGKEPNSTATVQLSNDMVLQLYVISDYLALTYIVRTKHFSENRGLIEYNIDVFKDGARKIIEMRKSQLEEE